MPSRLASLVPAGPAVRHWRRLLRRRRRPVTALLAAVCLLSTLHVLAPPRPPGVAVLVAARDLPGGTLLTAADLTLVRLPPSAVPAGTVTRPTAAGRTLAGPVRRGEPLTDVRLIGARLVDTLGPGLVATPVRLADPAVAALLQAGDRVDVLAAPADPGNGAATIVAAADVRVLAIPAPVQDAIDSSQGALVVLATTARTAALLAAASTGDRLSVILRG